MPKRQRQEAPKGPAPAARKPAKGNKSNEIDQLFANKKKAKQEQRQAKAKEGTKRSSSLDYSRKDVNTMDSNSKQWKDDGLGGKFNRDGFTGRKEDGVKIYKAHLFNERNFGNSAACPFDCKCCYI